MELPVIAIDEVDACAEDTLEEGESTFAWELRAMAVSVAWAPPGVLLGALVRLCLPESGPAAAWLICGGLLGAIAGGLLEAEQWGA